MGGDRRTPGSDRAAAHQPRRSTPRPPELDRRRDARGVVAPFGRDERAARNNRAKFGDSIYEPDRSVARPPELDRRRDARGVVAPFGRDERAARNNRATF